MGYRGIWENAIQWDSANQVYVVIDTRFVGFENGQSIAEMNLEAMDKFWEQAKDVLKNR